MGEGKKGYLPDIFLLLVSSLVSTIYNIDLYLTGLSLHEEGMENMVMALLL